MAIPPAMLAHPHLDPMPMPAYRDNDKCKDGCYSNDQLRAALDRALATVGRCTDQLDGIRDLSNKAVASNPKPP